MFEFTFNFYNSSEPFYVTHHTDTIDNELLQFLILIDLDFSDIRNFKTQKL